LGAFAGFVFVPGSRPAIPDAGDRDCVRREAAEAALRSKAEFQVLAATCANCHESSIRPPRHDRRSGGLLFRSRYLEEVSDELAPIWAMANADEQIVNARLISLAALEPQS